jgi:hypothetical protein
VQSMMNGVGDVGQRTENWAMGGRRRRRRR